MVAEGVFFVLLSLGIVALVAGVARTRLNWRPEASAYRDTRHLDVLLHPDRYANEQAVPAIRALNLVGIVAMAGVVGVLLCWAVMNLLPPFFGATP